MLLFIFKLIDIPKKVSKVFHTLLFAFGGIASCMFGRFVSMDTTLIGSVKKNSISRLSYLSFKNSNTKSNSKVKLYIVKNTRISRTVYIVNYQKITIENERFSIAKKRSTTCSAYTGSKKVKIYHHNNPKIKTKYALKTLESDPVCAKMAILAGRFTSSKQALLKREYFLTLYEVESCNAILSFYYTNLPTNGKTFSIYSRPPPFDPALLGRIITTEDRNILSY